MKTKIIILVGIPCSGKSTWAKNYEDAEIISRDDIREKTYGKGYKQNNTSEGKITSIFNSLLHNSIVNNCPIIILDNTHCKEKYITDIISRYWDKCDFHVKHFDIPLWKAHYRNIKRYITIRKWIPIKVINQMYKNYKQLNWLNINLYVNFPEQFYGKRNI